MKIRKYLKTIGAIAYKHRADIEFVLGLGLVATGTAMLINDSKDIAETITEHNTRKNYILENSDEMFKDDLNNLKLDDFKQTSVGLAKTVGKDVLIIAAGECLQTISHMSLNKQLANASLLLANVSTAYKNLKDRVVEDQGQEKLDEYLYGPRTKKVVVDKEGNVTESVELIEDLNANVGLPPHCFFFEEGNPMFSKSSEVNRDTLINSLHWLDQRLEVEGFLFENDIRRELKVPIVECGWTSGIFAYDENGNRNHLSFGFESKDGPTQRFLDGYENVYLIKLNLKDDILSKLKLSRI